MEGCSRFSNLKLLSFSPRALPDLARLYLDPKHAVFVLVCLKAKRRCNEIFLLSFCFFCLVKKNDNNCFQDHYIKIVELSFVYSLFAFRSIYAKMPGQQTINKVCIYKTLYQWTINKVCIYKTLYQWTINKVCI